MFEILDSLIATVTVVLVLSLVVQAMQQIAKQVFSMKSKYMERELLSLFHQIPYKRSMMPVLQQAAEIEEQNPEAKQLIDKIRNKLSGIGYNDLSLLEDVKKDDFLRIISDLLDTGKSESQDVSNLTDEDMQAIEKRTAFLRKARSDVDKWYDLVIKSFKDHYGRRMKMWSFAFAAIVVVWLNANVFDIYREFSTSKVLRDAAVKLGDRLAATPKDSLLIFRTSDGKDSAGYVPDSLAFKSIQTHFAYIDSMVNAQSFQLNRWGTPTGRRKLASSGMFEFVWNAVRHNLFGWLAMTLLVGLGAPFWYDVLKSIVGIKERLRGGTQPGGSNNNERSVASAQPVAPS